MHDEDQPTRGLRAQRSAPDGDTPEANELARWLRARVGSRSLRALENLFRSLPGPVLGPGRTQWNELLNGRKLIHPTLLDEIVKRLVPLREQRIQRERGHELLRSAQNAARLTAGSSVAAPHLTGLDETLQARRRVQATEQSIDGFIRVVLFTTTKLSRECKELRDERDRALSRLHEVETTANTQRAAENRKRDAENRRLLDDIVERLTASEHQLAEFEERLESAAQKKQTAEGLRAAASEQLTETNIASGSGAGSEDAGFLPVPRPPEYQYFLQIADAQLDIYTAELDAAREQITGSPAPGPNPQGVRIIPGQVVTDPSTDSTDTTTAVSGQPSRPPSADSTAKGAPGRSAASTARSENTGRPGRGPAAGKTRGQTGRDRTGRRSALAGVVCLALLAGGAGLVYNYNLDKEYVPANSPTLKAAKKLGRIDIGVMPDQPGLSEIADDGRRKGFEVDLANFIIKELGLEGKGNFKPVESVNRENGLDGKYDMIMASYSITDERAQDIDFSVPYFDTGQALMMLTPGVNGGKAYVKRDGNWEKQWVRSVVDLPDGTFSCTVKDSTSQDGMEEEGDKFSFGGDSGGSPEGLKTSYEECVEEMLDGESFVVVSTDDVILRGLAYKFRNKSKQENRNLQVLSFTFGSAERYGVGMQQNDPALKYLMCQAIKKSIDTGKWKEFYDDNLKGIMEGEEGKPPKGIDCKELSRKRVEGARN
ncbi:transporter substrate-binding domain-containing protein [Streptomyces sp. NPDC059096]|uniref:transporter substrate-binding domain-containing protein n=1 Tax=Streptomyces sp. NPDC059096 TaxID=3346727 RepID=UPI0036A20DA1